MDPLQFFTNWPYYLVILTIRSSQGEPPIIMRWSRAAGVLGLSLAAGAVLDQPILIDSEEGGGTRPLTQIALPWISIAL